LRGRNGGDKLSWDRDGGGLLVESDWNHYKELAERAMHAGDYPDAESLWFAALQIVEFDGEGDPRLATTLDGLAAACSGQRKYTQAQNLYWDAIKIKEKYDGYDSLNTAVSLKGLAGVYYEQGKYIEAEALGKRVLNIFEQTLGPTHADVGEIVMNLAALYHKQKNVEQAQKYYQRALEIKEQTSSGTQPKISTPFSQRTAKPTSVCPVCERTYVGDTCLKCTQTTLKAIETPSSSN
jgi:tetratricopeptide (TPR) repeat protein